MLTSWALRPCILAKSEACTVHAYTGDKCIFYQPASGGKAKARGRSRAFVPAFSGPATVLARISNVSYAHLCKVYTATGRCLSIDQSPFTWTSNGDGALWLTTGQLLCLSS